MGGGGTSGCCFSPHDYLLHLVANLGSNRQTLKLGIPQSCISPLGIGSSRALSRERRLVARSHAPWSWLIYISWVFSFRGIRVFCVYNTYSLALEKINKQTKSSVSPLKVMFSSKRVFYVFVLVHVFVSP